MWGIVVWAMVCFLISSIVGEVNVTFFCILFFGMLIILVGITSFKNNKKSKGISKDSPSIVRSRAKFPSSAMQKTLQNILYNRQETLKEIDSIKEDIDRLRTKQRITQIFIVGFFINSIKEEIATKQLYLVSLSDKLATMNYKLAIADDEGVKDSFINLHKSYRELFTSERMWNNISHSLRGNANSSLDFIKCIEKPIHFSDENGVDFYIYPNCVIAYDRESNSVGTYKLNEIKVIASAYELFEKGVYPKDAEVIRYAWAYSRKDGGPDLRYKNNRKIAKIRYGTLKFTFGQHSFSIYISNYKKCITFSTYFNNYCDLLANKTLTGVDIISVYDNRFQNINDGKQEDKIALINSTSNSIVNCKTSIKEKIEKVKETYEKCNSFEQIIDYYIEHTLDQDRFNSVQLEVLRWYLVYYRSFNDAKELSKKKLECCIRDRISKNKVNNNKQEGLIALDRDRAIEGLLLVLNKITKKLLNHDNNKQINSKLTINVSDQIIAPLFKASETIDVNRRVVENGTTQTNEYNCNELRTSDLEYKIQIEKLVGFLIRIAESKKNIYYENSKSNLIEGIVKQSTIKSKDIPMEYNNDINIAEFEIDEGSESSISSFSIPNQEKDYRNINRVVFDEMKKIPQKLLQEKWVTTTQGIFYAQAKYMERYEETEDIFIEFSSYYPTYEDMSELQLRSYFSWRKKVRSSIFCLTSRSYAYIYVYELINQIGANNKEECLEKLIRFWKEYRKLDSHLDRYLPQWIKDYVIYYSCSLSYLDLIKPLVQDNQRQNVEYSSNLIADSLKNKNYTDIIYHLNNRSQYKILKSKFYTSEWGYTLSEAMDYVLPDLEKYYKEEGKFSLFEKIVGKISTIRWYPFEAAIFNNLKTEGKTEFEISITEKYFVKDDVWFRTYLSGFDTSIITYILKASEVFLREELDYKYKMKLGYGYKDINKVIQSAIAQYCRDHNLRGKANLRKEVIKKDKKQNKNESNRIVDIKIDIAKLSEIREQAEAMTERLIVTHSEDDLVFKNEQQDKNIVIIQSNVGKQDNHNNKLKQNESINYYEQKDYNTIFKDENSNNKDATLKFDISKLSQIKGQAYEVTQKLIVESSGDEWKKLKNYLPDYGRQVLTIILSDLNANDKLYKLSQKYNLLLEVMIDEINEKALQCIGDNIIKTGELQVSIFEDYHEDIKRYIIKEA